MRPDHPPGFTLVELSIVLVVIAFIAGGIVGGSMMIQAANMRAAVSESADYKTRIYTFKLKYNYLPGDLPNAASVFGAGAFSGNGDGRIDVGASESLIAWQHMSLAGYTACPCTGVLVATNPRTRINTNVPPSKYSTSALFFLN